MDSNRPATDDLVIHPLLLASGGNIPPCKRNFLLMTHNKAACRKSKLSQSCPLIPPSPSLAHSPSKWYKSDFILNPLSPLAKPHGVTVN